MRAPSPNNDGMGSPLYADGTARFRIWAQMPLAYSSLATSPAARQPMPYLVGGSHEDPFEHRQIDLAQERLGKLGLRIERLPGGHLTTHEQPEALAALITKFEQGLARKLERSEAYGD
jgi:hypothetical protein